MFSELPQPTTRSAAVINSAASGDAKPPLTPRSHGLPWNSPLATADVASSAPHASASSSSTARAARAPRPATNTGRSAAPSAAASRTAASGAGAGGSSGGTGRMTGGAARPPPAVRRLRPHTARRAQDRAPVGSGAVVRGKFAPPPPPNGGPRPRPGGGGPARLAALHQRGRFRAGSTGAGAGRGLRAPPVIGSGVTISTAPVGG